MNLLRASSWPDRYLFLFSHMRSYSSVLSHVLGTHPDISGYSESHLKYRHSNDLRVLRWRIAKAIGGLPRGRFLLDKLLHNYMLIPRQLRNADTFRALIFVRRPVPTLQSILRMHALQPHVGWHGDPEAVALYYCERLTWIAAVGVLLKDRALAFPAEAIPGRTQELLGTIANHLELATALTPVYAPRRYTGQAAHGDISANIRAGEILPVTSAAVDQECSAFSAETMRQCERTYRRCVTLLADWCPSLGFEREQPRPMRLSATGSGR